MQDFSLIFSLVSNDELLDEIIDEVLGELKNNRTNKLNKTYEKIHLFVRKMSSINGRTLPFTYCGEMNYKSINGNAPINVDFELIEPLNEKLKQEFLRL